MDMDTLLLLLGLFFAPCIVLLTASYAIWKAVLLRRERPIRFWRFLPLAFFGVLSLYELSFGPHFPRDGIPFFLFWGTFPCFPLALAVPSQKKTVIYIFFCLAIAIPLYSPLLWLQYLPKDVFFNIAERTQENCDKALGGKTWMSLLSAPISHPPEPLKNKDETDIQER